MSRENQRTKSTRIERRVGLRQENRSLDKNDQERTDQNDRIQTRSPKKLPVRTISRMTLEIRENPKSTDDSSDGNDRETHTDGDGTDADVDPDAPRGIPDGFTDRVGKIAYELGRSEKEVREAIHKVKRNMQEEGLYEILMLSSTHNPAKFIPRSRMAASEIPSEISLTFWISK